MKYSVYSQCGIALYKPTPFILTRPLLSVRNRRSARRTHRARFLSHRRPARHMRRHGEDLHGRAVFHSEPGSRRCAGLAAVRGACGGARNLDHEQPAMSEFLEPAVPQVVAAPAARPMTSLNEFFAKIGGVAVYTNRISAELDGKDHPYRTWLSKQLPTEHAGTDPKTDAISMLGTRLIARTNPDIGPSLV